MQVCRGVGRILGISPDPVACADRLAHLQPTTCNHRRVALRPMVPARIRVDGGGTTKITQPNHQGLLQHSPFVQVIEKGHKGPLHRGNQPVFQAVEVVLMGVPHDARPVHGGDKAATGLQESSGKQV